MERKLQPIHSTTLPVRNRWLARNLRLKADMTPRSISTPTGQRFPGPACSTNLDTRLDGSVPAGAQLQAASRERGIRHKFKPGDVAYYNDWTHPRKLIVAINGDVAEVIHCWGRCDTLPLRNLSTQAEWVKECERCADGFSGNWKKQVEKHTDPDWKYPREWTEFILSNAESSHGGGKL